MKVETELIDSGGGFLSLDPLRPQIDIKLLK